MAEAGEVVLWLTAAAGVIAGVVLLFYACSRPAAPKPASVSEAEAIKTGAVSSASAAGGGTIWLPEAMVVASRR